MTGLAHKIRNLVVLVALAAFATGCSDDSPTSPSANNGNGGGNNIKTPIAIDLDYIDVQKYPRQKDNGDDWDFHAWDAAKRNPDMYIDVEGLNGTVHFSTSVKADNASAPTDISFASGTTVRLSADTVYRLVLQDNDWPSADDEMHGLLFRPLNGYNDDNADRVVIKVGGNNDKAWFYVVGHWVYQ